MPADLDELLQARVAGLSSETLAVARVVGAVADQPFGSWKTPSVHAPTQGWPRR